MSKRLVTEPFNATQPAERAEKTVNAHRDPFDNAIHIAYLMLEETAQYIIGNQRVNIDSFVQPKSMTEIGFYAFIIELESEELATELLQAFVNIPPEKLKERIGQGHLSIDKEGSEIFIESSSLTNIGCLVLETVIANERLLPRMRKPFDDEHVRDANRVNIKFLPRNIGYGSKASLNAFYVRAMEESDTTRRMQGFTYMPGDLRYAENAYLKTQGECVPEGKTFFIN